MTDLFSIENKIIIVTGGGRGIGQTLSFNLATNGAIVYSLSKSFSKSVPKNISTLFQIKCDINNKKTFNEICKKIFQKNNSIDVLINNAGISLPNKNNSIYPEKNWIETIQTNLTASFNTSQIVFVYMKKKKSGSIINITSINAEKGFPNNPGYIASKGGLKMLTKAFARDWGQFGIRVNNLGPGYIVTDMNKKSYNNSKIRKSRESMTMLGRWGQTEDLVGPCIFLASDASKYITGQDIYVDGGWISNGLPS